MKSLKNIIYVLIISIIIFSVNVLNSYANTKLKITAEYLNIRSEMSIDSTIVGVLTVGNICELLEEENGWYKISYNNMTGYISIKYAEKIEDNSNVEKEEEPQTDDENVVEDNQEEIVEEKVETNVTVQTQLVQANTGSLNTECKLKITPLISSSDLKELSMGKEVTIISTVNGWSYINVESYSGWIRTDAITFDIIEVEIEEEEEEDEEVEEETNLQENTNKEETLISKTVYTSSLYVNLREEASKTGKLIMTVEQNTKLTVIGEVEDWYKVSTSKGDCYVHKDLVSDSITKVED